MFGILSSQSLRQEVGAMVESFAKVCPPPAEIGNKRIPGKKVDESLQVLYREVASYARAKSLGIIGRARLANALQNEMRRRNYPSELVSQVITAVTAKALVGSAQR